MKSSKVSTLVLLILIVYFGYNSEALKKNDDYDTSEGCQENKEPCDYDLACCTENNLLCDFDLIGINNTGTCRDTKTHCVGLGKRCNYGPGMLTFRCCENQNLYCYSTGPEVGKCVKCVGLGETCDGLTGIECCKEKNLICINRFGKCVECAGLGQTCGGLTGIECCKDENLTCEIIPDGTDPTGKCVMERPCKQLGEFCGGIAGVVCCQDMNLICEFEGNFTDAGGTCVDAFACKGLGKVCGGYANFKCCDDLICKLEGDFPDAGGKCVKADKPCI